MTWSFTRQAKAELVQVPLGPLPRGWSELWGLCGQASHSLEGPWLRSNAAFVSRRGYRLMKQLGLNPRMRINQHPGRLEFSLWGNDVPPPDLEQSVWQCPKDFLRGAFLIRGYISDIDRPLHWEIACPPSEWADFVQEAMGQMGVAAHVTTRRQQTVVYLKDREQIAQLLGLMGAHQSILAMQSQSVVRSMKNQVNRLVNSETANMKRVVESALRDGELIQRIARLGLQETMDSTMWQLAQLRLHHPDWSFEELGRHMQPPLSKSAINHRLRKLRVWSQRQGVNR